MSIQTIRILPDYLANQIAAGEVVQRPESVVKELVENAIDAGATSVTVIVRDAGKQLIHVIDNGSGMSQDDLQLALVRHATSKISSEHDLHAIRTLGFRGEAMASIAAVADVEIRTKQRDDDMGWTLQQRPGHAPEMKPAAHDGGTQVLVRNLFYNVPARRKFLKADLTEFRHISETMQKLALSRPDVRVVLYDNQTLVFDAKPSDQRRRVADVLSLDPHRAFVEFDAEDGGIRVQGYAGLPHVARQSRSGQYVFLNTRPIVSRSIAHAVASAYEHLLDTGPHPVFVLFITIDPERVDVNVHPQKHEVKFDDERQIYLLVQQAVSRALTQAQVIPSFLGDVALAHRPLQSLPSSPVGTSMVINRLTGEVLQQGSPRSSAPDHRTGSQPAPQALHEAFDQLFARRQEHETTGILHAGGQYVITTNSEGLVVVDQRAAHERIIYERVLARKGEAVAQSLLFAVVVRLSPSRVALMREYTEELRDLGFRCDIEHDGRVHVHAVPSDIKPGNEESALEDLLQALEDVHASPTVQRSERLALAFASRHAVRRGEQLTHDEASALIRDLFACAVPHHSPRGEQTYILIPFDELAQRFR
jgi:DNA mismatch repair protein MutL